MDSNLVAHRFLAMLLTLSKIFFVVVFAFNLFV